VAKDSAEPVRWFRLAAEQGNARAQYNLGGMYEFGRGIQEDKKAALVWYDLASARGHKDAVEHRDNLMHRMADVEIVEAMRLAGDWKPNK
jgi:uncharacterized protein